MIDPNHLIKGFADGVLSLDQLERAISVSMPADSDSAQKYCDSLHQAANDRQLSQPQRRQLTTILDAQRDRNAAADTGTLIRRSNSDDSATVFRPAATQSAKSVRAPQPAVATGPVTGPATGSQNSGLTHPSQLSNAPAVTLAPGSVLKDRFVLEEVVGEGGMGIVFRARDLRKVEAQDRNPFVAVKVLNEDFRRHPDSLKALQREARKAQTLAHPNIVTVFDFDRDGGNVFLVMELLDGAPLDQVIRETGGKGLAPQKAFEIVRKLGLALAYAHEKGVVHSDFKPANAFLTKDGSVKVFDFGIARAMRRPDAAAGDMTLFDAGTLGALTPSYASCEMLDGQDPDPRDDIYALACVACELLTGHHPFARKSALVARNEGLTLRRARGLVKRTHKGLSHGLAFMRDDRTSSVEAFIDEIAAKPIPRGAIIGAAIAAGLLGLALAVYVPQYLSEKRIARVAAVLSTGDSKQIAAAIDDIEALNSAALNGLLLDDANRSNLLGYYKQEVATLTDEAAGRFDYALADARLTQLNRMVRDSAQVREMQDALRRARDDAYRRHSEKLAGNQQQSATPSQAASQERDVLATLRRIDPEKTAALERELAANKATAVRTVATAEDRAKLIERLKTKVLADATANNLKGALQTLQELKRELPPDDDTLRAAAAQIADVYVRLADTALAAGNYASANMLLSDGRKVSATSEALNKRLADLQGVMSLEKQLKGDAQLSAERIRAQLTALQGGLGGSYPAVWRSLGDVLAARIAAEQRTAPRAGNGLLPIAKATFAGVPSIDALRAVSEKDDALVVAASLEQTAKPNATANDACPISLAGYGARGSRGVCFDTLPSGKGPELVVIPAEASGGRAFAIGRYETSRAEWLTYCKQSNQCKNLYVDKLDYPLTSMSADEARRYVEWLSTQTARKYRLPSEAEWLRAAKATGAGGDKDFNCTIVVSGNKIRGSETEPVRSNRPNGWGLFNAIGNVQELVVAGSALVVRGGSHQDPIGECSVDLAKGYAGAPDPQTGLRVVRELSAQ